MNVITTLTARILDYYATNKNPCKNYGSEAAAESATSKVAMVAAQHFTKPNEKVVSARHVVLYAAEMGRWVGCVDLTELMRRNTSTGGYIGVCKGFFSY